MKSILGSWNQIVAYCAGFIVTASGNMFGAPPKACTVPAPLLAAPPTSCTSPAPGCLDSNFGTGGLVLSTTSGTGQAVAIQSDGKIIVAGGSPGSTGTDYVVLRYYADGSTDMGFGNNGAARIPGIGTAKAVALQSDGEIVVAGEGFWIVRLNPLNGAVDSKTQMFGSLASTAWALAVQSDDKIVAAGTGNGTKKQTTAWHIGRLNPDGSIDISFSEAINGGGARALILQWVQVGSTLEERIVVGGNNSGGNIELMRFLLNGQSDASFGPSGDGTVLTNVCNSSNWIEGLAIDAANNIVAAGTTALGSDRVMLLVRYTGSGVPDSKFGTVLTNVFGGGQTWDGGKGTVMESDGKIFVGGFASTSSSFAGYSALVRYNQDGTLDTTFGTAGAAAVYLGGAGTEIAIQPHDGKIVQAASGPQQLAVVRYWP